MTNCIFTLSTVYIVLTGERRIQALVPKWCIKGWVRKWLRAIKMKLSAKCYIRIEDFPIYTALQKYPTPSVFGNVTRTVGANNYHNNMTSDSVFLMHTSEHVIYSRQQHKNCIMIFCHGVTSIPLPITLNLFLQWPLFVQSL